MQTTMRTIYIFSFVIAVLFLMELVNVLAIRKPFFEYDIWQIKQIMQLLFSGFLISIPLTLLVTMMSFALRRLVRTSWVAHHRFKISFLIISTIYVSLFVVNLGDATFFFRQCDYFRVGTITVCGAINTAIDFVILATMSFVFGHFADNVEVSR